MLASQNHSPKRPREVAHSHVCESEQDGDLKELWPHHIRKVVMSEGEAREDAQILKDVPDNDAEYNKHHTAAPLLELSAVDQSQYGWRKDMQCNDHQHRNTSRNLQNSCCGLDC